MHCSRACATGVVHYLFAITKMVRSNLSTPMWRWGVGTSGTDLHLWFPVMWDLLNIQSNNPAINTWIPFIFPWAYLPRRWHRSLPKQASSWSSIQFSGSYSRFYLSFFSGTANNVLTIYIRFVIFCMNVITADLGCLSEAFVVSLITWRHVLWGSCCMETAMFLDWSTAQNSRSQGSR